MVGALLVPFVLLQARMPEPSIIIVTGNAETTVPADLANVYVEAEALRGDLPGALADAASLREKIVSTAQKIVPDAKLYRRLDAIVVPEVAQEGFVGGGSNGVPSTIQTASRNSLVRDGLWIDGIGLDQTPKLIRAILPFKGSNGISTTYGLKDPAAARRAVLHEAFIDAKTKATEVAESANLHLGEVDLIEAGNGATLSPAYDDHGGGLDLHPVLVKSLRAKASITVRFRLVK